MYVSFHYNLLVPAEVHFFIQGPLRPPVRAIASIEIVFVGKLLLVGYVFVIDYGCMVGLLALVLGSEVLGIPNLEPAVTLHH